MLTKKLLNIINKILQNPVMGGIILATVFLVLYIIACNHSNPQMNYVYNQF